MVSPASSNGGAGHADGDRGVLRGRGDFRFWIIGALTVLVRLRTLTFEAMTVTRTAWSPICRNSSRCVPPRRTSSACSLRPCKWHGLMMLYAIVSVMTVSLVGWWILSHVLEIAAGHSRCAQARLDQ